jgi:hypothetical protein
LPLSPVRSCQSRLTEEEYLQHFRKCQVDEFLRSKYSKRKFPEVILSETKPVNFNVISAKAIEGTIKDIKVTQNKESIRKELPKLLSTLKGKVENKNPKNLIENKYKLFLENYDK